MEIKIRCDKPIKMIPIEEIIPDPRNPNTHPPEQIELLTKNIEYQGWRHPIIISNRTGTMISGEGRTMAARALGMEKIPASFQDYDDETQEIFSIIAENELDKRSIIDQKKEADLMLEVDAGDFDMELTGKFEYEIENQMTAVHLEEIEEDKFNVEK